MTPAIGAILTGGASTRMGANKADVTIGGRSMLEHVAAAMGAVCGRVVLLGPDREGWEAWPDSVHAGGPLAGVATALNRLGEGRVLLVAVDHPYVRAETLARIVAVESDLPVVPVDTHGVRQVTCATYPASIAEAANDEATAGGSIQTLLDRVSFRPVAADEWESWGEDGRSWFSVDTPAAAAEAEATFG